MRSFFVNVQPEHKAMLLALKSLLVCPTLLVTGVKGLGTGVDCEYLTYCQG